MAEELNLREYIDTAFSEIIRRLKEMNETLEELKASASKSSGPAGPRKKRQPSKYNRFIGKCMKGTGKTMKACAVEYKQAKSDGTLDQIIAEE